MTDEFPEGKTRSSETVRIPAEMLKAIDDFLETEFAKSRGFRFKSDVVTAAVRDLLDKYGDVLPEESALLTTPNKNNAKS